MKLTTINSDMDVNEMSETYETITKDIMDLHAPLCTKTVKGDSMKPWYNEEIHEARMVRRKLERQYLKSGLTVHKLMYQEQSASVVHRIKCSKSLYYQDKLASADVKETYKLINGLICPNTGDTLPPSTSDEALATRFVQFFQDKVNRIRSELDVACPTELLQVAPPTPPPSLSKFEVQTQEDIAKIVSKCATKSCSLDNIPTSLLKNDSVFHTVLPILTTMVNKSLSSGQFPDSLKQAQVVPLLKKSGLDISDLKNYRPVSNIPFLSKVVEKVIAQQINDHLTRHGLHDEKQSAYKRGCSTETALLRIKADIDHILDDGDGVLLVLLDLSAAFDTIDHGILLQRLATEVGLNDKALAWVESYLTGRRQAVHINGCISKAVPLRIGVPQGSVLGPLLFLIYLLPLKRVIEYHHTSRHGFADDTQLYAQLCLKNPVMCASQIDKMQECLSDVRQWMLTNKLKLNDSKTEVLVIAAKSNIKLTESIKVKIGEEVISPTPVACNLGATLDNTMSMECQISSVTRKVYYNLRRIAKIKQYLTPSACANAINSTVISRLDFHNGLLLGLPAKALSRLQLAQHNAARVLTGTKRAEHITPVLQKLHWLPVQQRVAFKVLTTIQKALHSPTAPAYLAELLPLYRPVVPLGHQLMSGLSKSTECITSMELVLLMCLVQKCGMNSLQNSDV